MRQIISSQNKLMWWLRAFVATWAMSHSRAYCRKSRFVTNTRFFGFVLSRLLLRHLGFDSDFAQISEQKIGGWGLCTPSWPFLYFMFSSLSTVSSTDTWGVGETITQVSSSQYCVRPWQLLPMMEIGFTLATHWWQPKELFQKYGFTAWKKSVTEMQWQSNWGRTGGELGAT